MILFQPGPEECYLHHHSPIKNSLALMQILKASSEIWLILEDLRTTLEFEFLSQHKASHLNMTRWRGSGWPIPVLGAVRRRAPGIPYLHSTIPSLGYEVTSSFLSLLFFSVFLLPGYLCQGSLGPSRHQDPKSHWLTLLINMNSMETALSRLLPCSCLLPDARLRTASRSGVGWPCLWLPSISFVGS